MGGGRPQMDRERSACQLRPYRDEDARAADRECASRRPALVRRGSARRSECVTYLINLNRVASDSRNVHVALLSSSLPPGTNSAIYSSKAFSASYTGYPDGSLGLSPSCYTVLDSSCLRSSIGRLPGW